MLLHHYGLIVAIILFCNTYFYCNVWYTSLWSRYSRFHLYNISLYNTAGSHTWCACAKHLPPIQGAEIDRDITRLGRASRLIRAVSVFDGNRISTHWQAVDMRYKFRSIVFSESTDDRVLPSLDFSKEEISPLQLFKTPHVLQFAPILYINTLIWRIKEHCWPWRASSWLSVVSATSPSFHTRI